MNMLVIPDWGDEWRGESDLDNQGDSDFWSTWDEANPAPEES